MKRAAEEEDSEEQEEKPKRSKVLQDGSSDGEHEAHEDNLAGEPLIDEDYVDNIQSKIKRPSGKELHKKLTQHVDPSRVQCLTPSRKLPENGKAVIYWMSRDQRVHDNWALLYAQERSQDLKVPLVVVFNLVPVFLHAAFRTWSFLLSGMEEVEHNLEKLKIPFILLQGEPHETIPNFVKEHNVALIVADYNPLRISKKWKKDLVDHTSIPVYQVDAHNVVPLWVASDKQETAARTLRPKIHRLLPHILTKQYLVDFHEVEENQKGWTTKVKRVDWNAVREDFKTRSDVQPKPITWIKPGEAAATAHVSQFVTKRMKAYAENRNDPTKDAQSNLSPYIHFGSTCSQRIILEAKKYKTSAPTSYDSFLEELVVRKELSDNFCHYNPHYDSFEGFPKWAKDSLTLHQSDKREQLYTYEQLEQSKTYDRLWNAAQTQMVNTGKMHGFMRMYWGKKILEWTRSGQEAMEFATKLNDKFELDGRDPNGYVGCAWSIGGVHDQGWKERPVFGKVRYMNFAGCKRKFNVEAYITKYLKLCK